MYVCMYVGMYVGIVCMYVRTLTEPGDFRWRALPLQLILNLSLGIGDIAVRGEKICSGSVSGATDI